MLGSLKFKGWATHVDHRGWAFLSVVLHRLQRLTVLSPSAWKGGPRIEPGQRVRHLPGHSWVNRLSCSAWDRAVGHA